MANIYITMNGGKFHISNINNSQRNERDVKEIRGEDKREPSGNKSGGEKCFKYLKMMNAKENLYKIHLERIKVFEEQNPESGNFDVIFDFNGKKIYAHKYMLSPVSTTFNSMLSDRWTKPNEPISINNYEFEDFKELITFIYSGECKLTDTNVFSITDMAEFYGVQILKDACSNYLPKMALKLSNIFQMIEMINKYSMIHLQENVYRFISKNLSSFVKAENFQCLDPSIVKEIVEANAKIQKQEELFEAVYNWAENRAKKVEGADLDETIKKELLVILPLFKFQRMSRSFLVKFVVRKSFLFTNDQLMDILWAKKYVKVIDGNGKVLRGEIQHDDLDTVVDAIDSQKNKPCIFVGIHFWSTNVELPKTPSKLIKNPNVGYYLIYDEDGDLAIKKQSKIYTWDYLLAEMFAEDGFKLDTNCTIEIE